MGSASELEYQLILSRDLNYLDNDHYEKLEKQLLKHKAKHEGRKHHPDARDVESLEEREEQDEFNELDRRDAI